MQRVDGYYTIDEIAKATGMSHGALRNSLPEHSSQIGKTRLWKEERVEAWLREKAMFELQQWAERFGQLTEKDLNDIWKEVIDA